MDEHPGSHPGTPLQVFLSHAASDKPRVRELYRRLAADGFAPWLDEVALAPGQDWDREIRAAVRRADVVLVCLSRDAIRKAGYVQKEIRHVLDVAAEKPEGVVFLIPVQLEPCELPERFQPYEAARLYEPDGYARLVAALRGAGAAEAAGSAVASPGGTGSAPPSAPGRSRVDRPPRVARHAVALVLVAALLVVGALAALGALASSRSDRPAAGATGALEIRTDPGAVVRVDSAPGRRADAQGRLLFPDLRPGARHVRVTEAGHNPEERDVTVAAEQSAVLTVPLQAVAVADSSSRAALAAFRPDRMLPGHRGGAWHLAFSADGRRLASAGPDDTLRVWEVPSGVEVGSCTLDAPHEPPVLAFGPHDVALAAVGQDDAVRVIACGGLDLLSRTIRPAQGVSPQALAFSPDAARLVVRTQVGAAMQGSIWDLRSGAQVWSVPPPACERLLVTHFTCDLEVAYRADGGAVAVAGNGWVHVVDPRAGRTLRTLARQTAADSPDYGAPQFSPDGRWLGVVERGRDRHWAPDHIQLWDAASGRVGLRLGPFPTIERHADGTENGVVTEFALSPDGRGLAAASTRLAFAGGRQALGAVLHLYDLATGDEARRQDFPAGIASLAFSPNGRWLALGLDDGSIRLWKR